MKNNRRFSRNVGIFVGIIVVLGILAWLIFYYGGFSGMLGTPEGVTVTRSFSEGPNGTLLVSLHVVQGGDIHNVALDEVSSAPLLARIGFVGYPADAPCCLSVPVAQNEMKIVMLKPDSKDITFQYTVAKDAKRSAFRGSWQTIKGNGTTINNVA